MRADTMRFFLNVIGYFLIISSILLAKNYLSEKEVDSLNRLSNVFIDIAEQRAETYIVLTEGIVPYLTKILIQCENKPEITDGTSRISVTVCCQILFPIIFHTPIL